MGFILNHFTLKICFVVLPSSCYTFPCNLVREICVRLNTFNLLNLSILIACFLDNVWILQREVTC